MIDVVVVGAGPVGLATAVGLAARGVSVEVVERRTTRPRTSRAAAVHAGTLAVLDGLGVGAAVDAEGLALRSFTVRSTRRLLYEVDFSVLRGVRPHALALPQWRTEELLQRRAEELGVPVSTGETVQDLTPGRVRTDRRDLRCRLVVGADGTHSTVREGLGVPRRGRGGTDAYVVADVLLDPAPPQDGVVLHVAGPGALVVAPLPGGSTRLIAPAAAGTREQLLVDERAPGLGTVRRVLWSSAYEVSRRLATRVVADGAVLLGDAAHEHSPSGGQGMNLGVRDAASLVEPALAHLARGTSLQAWGRSRHAYARRVVAFTRALTTLETSRAGTRRVLDEVVHTARRSSWVHAQVARRLAGLDDPVIGF